MSDWVRGRLGRSRQRSRECGTSRAPFCSSGTNISNLALAPQIISLMGDSFLVHFPAGKQSLRCELIATTVTAFWAANHFFAASRTLQQDLARTTVNI